MTDDADRAASGFDPTLRPWIENGFAVDEIAEWSRFDPDDAVLWRWAGVAPSTGIDKTAENLG